MPNMLTNQLASKSPAKMLQDIYTKFRFIQEEAGKGNPLAKQYLEKFKREEVCIDWAHRVLINSIRQQRMLKMMVIADDRHFGIH
jgi:hypothetical protein